MLVIKTKLADIIVNMTFFIMIPSLLQIRIVLRISGEPISEGMVAEWRGKSKSKKEGMVKKGGDFETPRHL